MTSFTEVQAIDSMAVTPTELSIPPETLNLFSRYAGITDEAELRAHVIAIQQQAVAVASYRCIREFRFIMLRAKAHPYYSRAVSNFTSLHAHNPSKSPKFCDLGCALGTDLRQFVLDGISGENTVGIDISADLIGAGFELFRETPQNPRQPITWIVGDVLDDGSFTGRGPLAGFRDKFDLIYTGAVIHLFAEDAVQKFLTRAAEMLAPGGTIFGRNAGAKTEPFLIESRVKAGDPSLGPSLRYLHSQKSIKDLLTSLGLAEVETWSVEREWPWVTRGAEDNNPRRGEMANLCWKAVKPAK